jgi:hypothetical protein
MDWNLLYFVALPISATILAPFVYNWIMYRYSTPKLSAYFKPTLEMTYEEKKVQEIKLQPDKKQLVWVILHNNGKLIKDNWFCIIRFEKEFVPIPIETTKYAHVDFSKRYTVQKKYNVAHFNSMDFSPLFPYNETMIFPVAVKTPKKPKKYKVNVTVFTGNHRNKFIHDLFISVIKSKTEK